MNARTRAGEADREGTREPEGTEREPSRVAGREELEAGGDGGGTPAERTVDVPDGPPSPGTPGKSQQAALEASRRVVRKLLGPTETRSVRVEYWEGSVDGAYREDARLRLTWPGALRRMLVPPDDLSVGEAYVRGDVDLQGDVEALVRVGWEGMARVAGPARRARVMATLARLPRRHPMAPEERTATSRGGDGVAAPKWRDALARYRPGLSRGPRRDAGAVRHHYDLGNDFFRLFLDEAMQYSCAYYQRDGADLEEAQRAKLDLVCRKLRLRPGERLLDVGTGWGGLLVHAASHYGVHATGITLSAPQAEWAREAIQREGLGDRCRVELRDYRELASDPELVGAFDKVASVGMIEHVGLANYGAYFASVHAALRPGGLFLNHGIVHLRRGHSRADRARLRTSRRRSFIHRHIFPASDLVPVGPTLTAAERAGFEVRDVESLREHYARTLRAWLGRLEERWDEAVRAVGEPTARAWRFYMGASAHLFASGYVGVVQSLLARPDAEGAVNLPSTRQDLYAEGG